MFREVGRPQGYWGELAELLRLLQEADSVVLGVGGGVSAAGGLDLSGPLLAQAWYPEYVAEGRGTLAEIIDLYRRPYKSLLESYWGFWARQLRHVLDFPPVRPCLDLLELVRGKPCFICTTNTDGQLEKAGFAGGRIYAPQGDCHSFRCYGRCSDEVWDNGGMLRQMLENMPTEREVRGQDIPRCPRCGGYLVPNLHLDELDLFAGGAVAPGREAYREFLEDAADRRLLLLELGAGSTGIIRGPFEEMARELPQAALVRVNLARPQLPHGIGDRSIAIRQDVGKVLEDLLYLRSRQTGR